MRVDLELPTEWLVIEPAGELIRAAASTHINDPKILSQVLVASRELLENAVKYSAGNTMRLTLRCEPPRAIELAVQNVPRPDHLDTLRYELERLQNTDDSLKHYLSKMAQAAAAPHGKSGLGLARIYHESEMTIHGQVDNTVLTVTARHR